MWKQLLEIYSEDATVHKECQLGNYSIQFSHSLMSTIFATVIISLKYHYYHYCDYPVFARIGCVASGKVITRGNSV